MPTVSVDKADLWERLGKEYSRCFPLLFRQLLGADVFLATEEFDQLCFDYGLELDEDVRLDRTSEFRFHHSDSAI